MNPNVALPIIVVLIVVLVVNQFVFLRRKESRPARLFSSGGLFFLAILCGLLFLGAGDIETGRQLPWKIGSFALGGLALLGSFYMAWKKQ